MAGPVADSIEFGGVIVDRSGPIPRALVRAVNDRGVRTMGTEAFTVHHREPDWFSGLEHGERANRDRRLLYHVGRQVPDKGLGERGMEVMGEVGDPVTLIRCVPSLASPEIRRSPEVERVKLGLVDADQMGPSRKLRRREGPRVEIGWR